MYTYPLGSIFRSSHLSLAAATLLLIGLFIPAPAQSQSARALSVIHSGVALVQLQVEKSQEKANPVRSQSVETAVQISGGITGIQAQSGLTPLQTSSIQTVTSATRSADGVHVAYTLHTPADPLEVNRPAQNHLYLLNTETGETRALYEESSAAAVAFRPGHGSVTFLAVRQGDSTRALYEVPLEGGEPEKVHSHQTHIMTYAWSSDGDHLAYAAPEELQEPTSDLPYQPEFYEENQPQRPAFLVEPNGEADPLQIAVDGAVYMLQWSPDNSRIALTVAPTSSIDDYYMSQSVRVIDSRTGEVTAEIDNEGKIGQIEWSPDGQRLALRAGRDRYDPIDGRILIADAEGGEPVIIDSDYEGKYEQIAWVSDNEIHFIASQSVWSVYGSIAPDGSRKEIHSEDGPVFTSFETAGDGSVLFTANSDQHPTEVYLLRQGEVDPERLTRHNSWLEGVALGEQEVVSWESRDGEWELDGIFIWPVGHDGQSPVPVVTVVHGGPEAHYSNGWITNYSTPGQMAAAKGYGVFYPNYRGSTGRGIEFVHSSQADAGGAEFDDIVDGVDHLIAEGVADGSRIGVTGGSYGGYASAWMSTYYSDRFAAAVMFVGVSNNISKWGTSDIPDELYYVHSRERIWEDNWMKYLERSPIYWVDRAQTPILITHGSEDTRVHPAQSMELYRHLKVRKPDLPVRLIWYPGEGHGNINSASRLDYNLRLLEWFDTYLMSGDADAELPDQDLEVPNREPVEAVGVR